MKKISLYSVYLLLATLLSACLPQHLETLQKNKALWEQQNISNYTFTVHENCGGLVCPLLIYPSYKVTVYKNKVVKVQNVLNEYEGAPINTEFKWAKTFDDIFDAVETQFDPESEITVEFDASRGFITQALDFIITDVHIQDSNDQTKKLATSKQLWQASSTSDYTLSYTQDCFCMFPANENTQQMSGQWLLNVANNNITRASVNNVDVTSSSWRPLTMDDFYATAEQAVATAAHVELHYNEQGILSGINVDWNKAIADEEMYYHNIKLQQP